MPGRHALALKHREDTVLCQRCPVSHGAPASSGAASASPILLFQSPLEQEQHTQISAFTVQRSVILPAVIIPTSTIYVHFLETQD